MPRMGPPTLERMSRQEHNEVAGRRPRWFRPNREWAVLLWSTVMVIGILMCVLLYGGTEEDAYLIMGIFVVVFTPLGYLKMKAEHPREWKNAFRGTGFSFDRVVVRVRDELQRATVPFELRGMKSMMGPVLRRYTEEFILGRGLVVEVVGYKDTMIYIGPVTNANRRNVEWLKGLVDEALG